MSWFLLITIFIFLPEPSYAWGPLTHAYLSVQILSLSGLLATEVLKIPKLPIETIKNAKAYFCI